MDRSVSGIQIKALTGETEETSKVCSWLENGVFEALKLKYVFGHLLTLAVTIFLVFNSLRRSIFERFETN
jgi:hypothetical protein